MALGTMAAPRLAEAVRRSARGAVAARRAPSLFLAALALATNVWTFVALRFVQVLCIAPIFPLAVAAIAQRASGQVIGFLNSARIGASFVGPVLRDHAADVRAAELGGAHPGRRSGCSCVPLLASAAQRPGREEIAP